MTTETYTASEVIDAISAILKPMYYPKGCLCSDCQPARVLRYHLDCLKAHQKDDLRRAEYASAYAPFKAILEVEMAKQLQAVARLEHHQVKAIK